MTVYRSAAAPRTWRRALAFIVPVVVLNVAGCPTLVNNNGNSNDNSGSNTNTNSSLSDVFAAARAVDLASDGKATLTDSINRGGGVDIYKLSNLKPGDQVTVDVRATSGDLDPVAAIFDDLENMIAFNDDRTSDGSNVNPLIDFTIRGKAGDYFVGVAPFSVGNSSGNYRVSIDVVKGNGTGPAPEKQTIYLDFVGGNSITVENVGTFDLTPFSAADVGLPAGRTAALKAAIKQGVVDRYQGYNLQVITSDESPEPTTAHSNVYFGGFNRSAFAISQQIDTMNNDQNDDCIIFTESFKGAFTTTPTLDDMATAISNTVAHEVGHLLGMVHTKSCKDLMDTTCGNDSILTVQTFTRASVDESVFPVGFQDATEILTWVLGLAGM